MYMDGDWHRPLPYGWHWRRLGDVCAIMSGSTPRSEVQEFWGGDIDWVTPTDLGANDAIYIDHGARHITSAGLASAGLKVAPTGSVIMSSRAPIGHLAIAGVPLCTNQGCKTFIPGETVNSMFLYFALKQSMPAIQRMGSGATFLEVSKSKLEGCFIPLPPLAEQRRIAAILAERMSAVERARAAAEARVEAAKALPAAELRAVFESEEAQAWPKMRLGDAAHIVSGVMLGRKRSEQATKSVLYLRVANVKDGHLDLADVSSVDATRDEINKLMLQWGDVLLTEGGDPDKLGRGTYWRGELAECIHQNHIFRARFDLNHVSPEFVSAQISSPYGKAYFLSHAKQTTGIATINQQVLRGFPLMLPPLHEQLNAAMLLDTRMADIAQLQARLTAQLDAINALPAALLRQAFSGELTLDMQQERRQRRMRREARRAFTRSQQAKKRIVLVRVQWSRAIGPRKHGAHAPFAQPSTMRSIARRQYRLKRLRP